MYDPKLLNRPLLSKMADVPPVVKAGPGHLCRVVLAITSAVLLVPYMVIKHGPTRLDSTLIRETLTQTRNNTPLVSMRHLQAIRGTKSKPRSSLLQKKWTPLLPPSAVKALNYNFSGSGYLVGSFSHLEFREYKQDVDLRIIVLAYNRGSSLKKCLMSLNSVDFGNSTVSLHVWIDKLNTTNKVDIGTYDVAQNFHFSHGEYYVHVQKTHVGILSQWVNTWRPCERTNEIALILEDDMIVSRHFWRWLKPVHAAYRNHSDISGFGLSHPGMEHMHATYLDIPARFSVYMYKVICTWGFSPHPNSWRHFQEWFYRTEVNSSLLQLVPQILPSEWFLAEQERGRERDLWEVWHICYSHYSKPAQYTVMLNSAQEGLLAVNRHEVGLHDRGATHTGPLCKVWKDIYGVFPKVLPRFGYDGKLENGPEVDREVDEADKVQAMDRESRVALKDGPNKDIEENENKFQEDVPSYWT